MKTTRLLHMTAPVRTPFEVPYHDIGDPAAPLRLALVAGVHGNELNGIYVLSHLARFLGAVARGERPPIRLAGRVVVVPAVNVLGVNLRRRTWPFDGTDINRMFPGYDVGETTQRIAHAVLETTKAAALRIDVHSSNLEFEELPQVRLYDPSEAERRTARLFGLPAVVERPTSTMFSATLGHAWRTLGGESFVLQAGRAGDLQLEHADRLFGAIVRFCTRVGILTGTRLADEDDEVWHFGPRQTLPLVSEHAGLFVSKVKVGAWLRAGDHIGFVYDAFDATLRAEVKAPRAGLLSGLRRQPLLCEGDLVARIETREELPLGGADTFLYGHGQ
jgi:predicted deacylase